MRGGDDGRFKVYLQGSLGLPWAFHCPGGEIPSYVTGQAPCSLVSMKDLGLSTKVHPIDAGGRSTVVQSVPDSL